MNRSVFVADISDMRVAAHPFLDFTPFSLRRGRKGMALMYLMVMLMALCAFASLAVDWGRVQMAKTKLSDAASSAAHAAAATLKAGGSNSDATNAALQYSVANNADGTPVVIDPTKDITYGTWDLNAHKFSAGGSSPNAVRVTAHRSGSGGVPLVFGALVGQSNCSVTTSAIAWYGTPNGFFGINESYLACTGGDLTIDSYDSGLGSYGGTNIHALAGYLSNGWNNVSAYNNDTSLPPGHLVLNGFAAAHPPGSTTTYSFDQNGSISTTRTGALVEVTKGTVNLNTALLPLIEETLPGSNDNAQLPATNFYNYGGGVYAFYGWDGSSITLPGGTYVMNTFSISNGTKVTFTGPTHIYACQSIYVGGGSQLSVYGNRPSDLKLSTYTSPSGWSYQYVMFFTDQPHYADVYAPNALFYIYPQDINGNRATDEFFGRVRADTIDFYGAGKMHWDEAFGRAQTGNVEVVK